MKLTNAVFLYKWQIRDSKPLGDNTKISLNFKENLDFMDPPSLALFNSFHEITRKNKAHMNFLSVYLVITLLVIAHGTFF